MESGIYKFWSLKDFDSTDRGVKNSNNKSKNRETIEFQDLGLPIFVIAVGSIISLLVLFLECLIYYLRSCCANTVSHCNIKITRSVRKKKLNLDKWLHKYIFKKKLQNNSKSCNHQTGMNMRHESKSIMPVNLTNEVLKCRESKGGGYFILKKFSMNKVPKNRHRFIQVKPRQEESTSQLM